MVYLKDLAEQYPWNSTAEEAWEDKEIYTHHIDPEDASQQWIVPIFEPLQGFAYTGFRIHVLGKSEEYTMGCRLVVTHRQRNMFGAKYDTYKAKPKQWIPLAYPITHKMVAIDEDGLSLIIEHDEAVCGAVEFIAQRFDDMLKDESEISYCFLNDTHETIEFILSQNNYVIKPTKQYGPCYPHPIKVLPPISRLLDKQKTPWEDTEAYWNTLQYTNPLERI
jgi:hypothetical protein